MQAVLSDPSLCLCLEMVEIFQLISPLIESLAETLGGFSQANMWPGGGDGMGDGEMSRKTCPKLHDDICEQFLKVNKES